MSNPLDIKYVLDDTMSNILYSIKSMLSTANRKKIALFVAGDGDAFYELLLGKL